MSSNTGQTFLALLTGAVIGAAFGILYAPDKGANTRKKIKKRAEKMQNELKQKLNETKENLAAKAKSASESFKEKLEETISSASYKTDDVLKAMEQKLETLRAQNAKLQKK